MNFRRPLFWLFVTVCLLFGTLPASKSATAQVQLGLVGGANFASLSDIRADNNTIAFDNATAYHAGIFLDLNLGPLNLRPAVYYLNAGPLFEGSSVFQNDNFDLSYVTIPVDVVFNFGLGPLKPYVFLGPEFRILTASDLPDGIENDLENFVFNGSTGLGLKIDLPGVNLTLYPQLRYSFGLSNYTNDNYQFEGLSVQANDANVRMWLLSLGVGF